MRSRRAALTNWKESLFRELYARATEELTGEAPVSDEVARKAELRDHLRNSLSVEFGAEWLEPQLTAMPLSYLLRYPPERVATHLRAQKNLDASGVRVESEHLKERGLTQIAVYTRDASRPASSRRSRACWRPCASRSSKPTS
jgi:UTP:GlnB (protein PII) uridylyltransferase